MKPSQRIAFKQYPRYQFSPIRTGNAMISTANKKFGTSSLLLDGASDDIRIYDTGTAVRPGDFTIEMWIYVYTTSTSNGLFDWRTSGSNLFALAANINTVGNLRLVVNGVQVMAGGTVTAQAWNHIALVRNGSTTRWFLNGSFVQNFTDNNDYSGYSQMIIGSLTGGNNNPYRGFIDEFRYSRIARYPGATSFTPSDQPFTDDENTVLLLHFEDYNGSPRIIDDIGNGVATRYRQSLIPDIWGDAKISTAQYKFGSSSLVLDGTGDCIKYTSDTLWIGQNDFTIEMWAYIQNISVARHLYDQRTATTSQVVPLIRVYSTGLLSYFVNGLERIVSASNAISTNTWYHIAVCRSGTSTRMFLDGVQVGSTFTDTFNYLNQPVNIGSYLNGTDNVWQGYIDEVRLSNTARYTANFTPPSAAFTHDDNTVLLLHMEGSNNSRNIKDDTPFTATTTARWGGGIEVRENAYLDTYNKKFGTSSLNLTGGGSFEIRDFNFDNLSGDFTMEGWLMIPSAITGQKRLISSGAGSSGPLNASFVDIRPQAGGAYDIEYRFMNQGPTITENWNTNAGQVWTLGTWYHFAICRYNSTGRISIFLNGVRRSSQPTSLAYPMGTGVRTLCFNYAQNLIFMDEVRFSSVARYADGATYTIPTAAFTNDASTLLLLHFDGDHGSTTLQDDNT